MSRVCICVIEDFDTFVSHLDVMSFLNYVMLSSDYVLDYFICASIVLIE